MGDIATLLPLFDGAYGIYSVQNPVISGPDAEVRQGKNVTDAASRSGVRHLVYGSAGIGRSGTGVSSWETKVQKQFVGKELALAGDVQTLGQCRAIYREVMGRNPPRLPMPAWLFKRFGFVGRDLTTMWRWLGAETIALDTGPTRSIHPGALTVRAWLRSEKQASEQGRARAA